MQQQLWSATSMRVGGLARPHASHQALPQYWPCLKLLTSCKLQPEPHASIHNGDVIIPPVRLWRG